jgi:hypothetical protein
MIFFIGDLNVPFVNSEYELLKENYNVYTFDLSTNYFSFTNGIRYLVSIISRIDDIRKSDIVWIWFADYPILPFVVLGKLFDKPVVVTIGGWEVSAQKEIGYGNQLNLIRGAVTRWIMCNCNTCICLSEYYKKLSISVEPRSNVVVVPGWIDVGLCNTPLPEKTRSVATALFAVTPETSLLKGIPTFFESTKGLDARVLSDHTHDKLIEELQSAKVYCQLSYSESFGMALLEAMACGCIPVVSDREALPEVVKGCGLVVPYGDVDKTRAAIVLALNAGVVDVVNVRERAMYYSKERKKNHISKIIGDLCNR